MEISCSKESYRCVGDIDNVLSLVNSPLLLDYDDVNCDFLVYVIGARLEVVSSHGKILCKSMIMHFDSCTLQ